MSSYYAPRRRSRRRFRRSPLSDLLMGAAALALIVLLIFLIRGLTLPSGEHGDEQGQPSSSPPPLSSQPEPSQASPGQPAGSDEIPWYLTLVNKDHPLPEDFAVETANLPNGKAFDVRAYDALTNMLSACRGAGLEPLVCSAYRTVETQTELFNNKVNGYMANGMSYDEAYAATATEIAIPGTSEHSLGLAADIVDINNQNLDESQEKTEVQKWLMEHCWEYGFILRYPNDKSEITCIIYEPWHYRYVGEEVAKEIMENGLCLEEYMEQHYGLK